MLLEKLKERKAELRLTNAQVAELSGLPLSTINSTFSGQVKSPSLFTAGQLCKVLGVSLDSYLGITNDEMDAAEVARIQAEYAQHEDELNRKLKEHANNILLHEVTIENNQEIIRRQDLRIGNLEDRIKSQVHVINIFRVWILALHVYGFLMDSMVPDAGLIRGIEWRSSVAKILITIGAVAFCVGAFLFVRWIINKKRAKDI